MSYMLNICRFSINRIDDLLYKLLQVRFWISTRTILYKPNHEIMDKTRENNILERFQSGSLSILFVKELWTLIFNHSKHLQSIYKINFNLKRQD